MVDEVREQHASEWVAMAEIVELLDVGAAETVRRWVRQSTSTAGQHSGVTTEESAELKRLKRENSELQTGDPRAGSGELTGASFANEITGAFTFVAADALTMTVREGAG